MSKDVFWRFGNPEGFKTICKFTENSLILKIPWRASSAWGRTSGGLGAGLITQLRHLLLRGIVNLTTFFDHVGLKPVYFIVLQPIRFEESKSKQRPKFRNCSTGSEKQPPSCQICLCLIWQPIRVEIDHNKTKNKNQKLLDQFRIASSDLGPPIVVWHPVK